MADFFNLTEEQLKERLDQLHKLDIIKGFDGKTALLVFTEKFNDKFNDALHEIDDSKTIQEQLTLAAAAAIKKLHPELDKGDVHVMARMCHFILHQFLGVTEDNFENFKQEGCKV